MARFIAPGAGRAVGRAGLKQRVPPGLGLVSYATNHVMLSGRREASAARVTRCDADGNTLADECAVPLILRVEPSG